MQKITLIGNLTHDPETRTTPKGDTVCTFTLAVNRRFPVNGERVTDYFRINAWRTLGETCSKFLSKGKKCAVVGELQPRLYDDRNGETRLSLDVSADEIEFLSPRGEGAASADTATAMESSPHTNDAVANNNDDLPF